MVIIAGSARFSARFLRHLRTLLHLTRWFLEDYAGCSSRNKTCRTRSQPSADPVRIPDHFFSVVEPEGLNRLWRNIRNYFPGLAILY